MPEAPQFLERYRMSYKFNAAHNTSGREDGQHVHTFRLVIFIGKTSDSYVDFYDYENRIKSLVDRYSGKVFNDFEEFSEIRPTVENIAIYIYRTLSSMFESDPSLKVVQVELGDSPTQRFSVSDDYVICSVNRTFPRERLLRFLEERRI